MAREQIPITRAVLTWARERAGYTIEAASEKWKNISAWEKEPGEDEMPLFPTYVQLEEMAEAFKVPVAVFFFPTPPDVPRPEETFRTLPEAELSSLEPRIKLLLRKAKALQINLAELNGGRNPARRLITRDLQFPVTIEAEEMAEAVRQYLGVSVEDQASWASVEAALEKWRAALVDVGVFVFKDQFRSPRFAGFCLTDEEFPIVYVNNTSAKSRQIFTLFHELGHLLFHTSGVDFRSQEVHADNPEDRRIEVLCNRFAGAILVPAVAFLAQMAGREANYEAASELAAHFKVSMLVIYRKFRDLRLISATEYAEAHQRAEEAEREGSSGGNFYNNQMAYLGRAYIGMALRAYKQQRISEEQLADYLLIQSKNVRGIEERYLKGVAA
jgi:Zn-dependent peptidase ImmA (M78 family)